MAREAGWQPTACILCSLNCGIEVQVADGRLKRIRGDKAHPSSKGYLYVVTPRGSKQDARSFVSEARLRIAQAAMEQFSAEIEDSGD